MEYCGSHEAGGSRLCGITSMVWLSEYYLWFIFRVANFQFYVFLSYTDTFLWMMTINGLGYGSHLLLNLYDPRLGSVI